MFFFKQKSAYDLRISDWSSDVCSSDLPLTAAIVRPTLLIDSARLLAVTMISPAPRLSLCGASAAADWAAGCSAGASLWANAGEQKQRSATPDASKLMPCRFVMLYGLTIIRSEERRVVYACVMTCRSLRTPLP